jgi:hypothetical protein
VLTPLLDLDMLVAITPPNSSCHPFWTPHRPTWISHRCHALLGLWIHPQGDLGPGIPTVSAPSTESTRSGIIVSLRQVSTIITCAISISMYRPIVILIFKIEVYLSLRLSSHLDPSAFPRLFLSSHPRITSPLLFPRSCTPSEARVAQDSPRLRPFA